MLVFMSATMLLVLLPVLGIPVKAYYSYRALKFIAVKMTTFLLVKNVYMQPCSRYLLPFIFFFFFMFIP